MTKAVRTFLAVLCVFLAARASYADDALSNIAQRLTKSELICGKFVQSKSLRALTRPLVSHGNMIFAAGKGVLWQILKPFPARALVTGDALIKWDDNNVPHRVSYGQTPAFRALSEVFLSVFAGELGQLRKTFTVESNMDGRSWQLTLVPRDSKFAVIIAAIRVSGDKFVDEIIIGEGRGDKTLIEFSDMNAEICQLGDAEKSYFAQ